MNRIVALAKCALLVIPAVLFLVGCFMLAQTPDNKKNAGIRQIVKRVWIIALVLALVYVGCFMGVRQVQSGLEGSITIGLNYAEASKGLNPNGTRFNTYDIISDDVLEAAIAEGNLGDLTAQELRDALSVEPLEAGSYASAEHYYVATEYVLSFNATGKTEHLNGSQVVQAVASAYYDSFQEQYSRKTDVMELDFTQVDAADYLDKVELLDKYASGVAEYLEMCSNQSQTYAAADGETFGSLAAKVDSLSDVELERLKSFILVKGLSVDADQQLSKLNYLNLIKDINADKNSSAYGIHLEAIEMYERDMATIVLIPTRDDDGEFYMSRTKIGVDVFADQAEDYSRNASNAKSYISTNNYAISQLAGSSATDADFATADAMAEAIKTNLQSYAQKGLDMAAAYDADTVGGYLTFSQGEYDMLSKGNLLKYGILLVYMGASSGLFLAAILGRKRRKKEAA